MKTNKKNMKSSASAEESATLNANKSVKELTPKERMQDAIEAIKTNYKEAMDGQQKSDRAATKIGQALLKIETEKLFKQDVSKKDGKPTKSMTQFIINNFEFKCQYGIMLKQSAKVQQTLKLNDDVSFRLLRALNSFTEKPDAMKAIWKDATGTANGKIPDKKTLNQAIRKWVEANPKEASKGKRKMVTFDTLLKKEDLSLKEVAVMLGKWTQQTVSEETEKLLLNRIKTLLHAPSKEAKTETRNN